MNLDEIIELLISSKKKDNQKTYDTIRLYFDNSHRDLYGYFFDNKEITSQLVNENLGKLLNLRKMIDTAKKLTNNQRKSLLVKLDNLINSLLGLDLDNNFLKEIITNENAILITHLIKASYSNDNNFNRIDEFINANRELISEEFYDNISKTLSDKRNQQLINIIDKILKNPTELELANFKDLVAILDSDYVIDYNTILLIEDIKDQLEKIEVQQILDPETLKELIRKLDLLLENANKDDKIKRGLETGKYYISILHPEILMSKKLVLGFDYKWVRDKKIITVDDSFVPDRDTAFSIENFDGTYLLDVYVSDVPSVLCRNRDFALDAYKRGCSYYIRKYKNSGNINIDMLPPVLSRGYYSLIPGYQKRVIDFSFIFDKKGNMQDASVTKRRIEVSNAVTPEEADRILRDESFPSPVQTDIRLLQELKELILQNAKDNGKRIYSTQDLIGITSVIVNMHIAEDADMAIYRNKGVYTKEKSDYTHSTTPLRRFVSNINLALYLYQNGLMDPNDFNMRDVLKIEAYMDEIIAHLNDVDALNSYIDAHQRVLRKALGMEIKKRNTR